MAVLDLNASEALQFAGIAAVTYFVMWWIVRPLSFVYRLDRNRISVRSFFLLRMAKVRLSEISQVEVGRPPEGKPVRWLVSPYRRWSGQTVFAETKREWVALPGRIAGELAAWSSKITADEDPPAQFRGDAGYQHVLAGLMAMNLAVRKLASWCVPLPGAAAWCLILLPLWLTAIDLIGVRLFSSPSRYPVKRILEAMTYQHFAASGFLVACGIAVRVTVSYGLRIPRLLAGLCLLASIYRLTSSGNGMGHDLSHLLFDSCTGYDDKVSNVGIATLTASGIIALASWATSTKQTQVSGVEGFAATP
jgi:hypothetical protein